MSDLIDTTEMYLKAVFELEEAGIPALRARIVERLEQSGPTVSETVARLERDGLLTMGEHRRIEFTDAGFVRASNVMRRHRLAERLLVDVIKLPLRDVHSEACRWEHVISDGVAQRISDLLGGPVSDPFGNTIPAYIDEALSASNAVRLRSAKVHTLINSRARSLGDVLKVGTLNDGVVYECCLACIGEQVQVYKDVIALCEEIELLPGSRFAVSRSGSDNAAQGEVRLATENGEISLGIPLLDGLYVNE